MDATGRESVVVVASDRSGGEEIWTAKVSRDDAAVPLLGAWQRLSRPGRFMFMLHVGVGSMEAVNRIATSEGVPPEFASAFS